MGNNLFLIVVLVAMFILLFVVPSRRQRKYLNELQARQNQMTPGTKVKTAWGLYGTIVNNGAETGVVQLEIAPNTVVEIDRMAVTEIVETTTQTTTDSEEN